MNAALYGTVTRAEEVRGYGLTIRIQHSPTLFTHYAHLSTILVKPGDDVGLTTIIGHVGRTGLSQGPHLDFEVLMADDFGASDLEPLDWLRGGWHWALDGLNHGAHNARVRALQQLLNRNTRSELKVDGQWGKLTSGVMRKVCGEPDVDRLLNVLWLTPEGY